MWTTGYCHQEAIDYSASSVLHASRVRDRVFGLDPAKGAKKLPILQMDAADLRYPTGSFEAVIDKGLLDPLLEIEAIEHTVTHAEAILMEIARVLRPGGLFFLVLRGNVDRQTECLESMAPQLRIDAAIVLQASTGELPAHLYVLRKVGIEL